MPKARAVIHLGATSCYVTDNGDLIQIRQGLKLIQEKMKSLLQVLAKSAKTFAALPCLAFTHFQRAQPTTVGKRFCLWLQDFLMDYEDLSHVIDNMKFLGVKGATGTQASFLELFEGDATKVQALDQAVAQAFAFENLLLFLVKPTRENKMHKS